MVTIGIIGNGFVGQATAQFECAGIDILIYDTVPHKCKPIGLTLSEITQKSDVIMLCVPTPMKSSGECETQIVEQCIKDIRTCTQENKPHIVVRSTVPVGFCERYSVYHMPEFLTEANWQDDFKNCDMWVVGSHHQKNTETHNLDFKRIMLSIIQTAKHKGKIVCDTISFVDTNTSEFVKYGRNCFLAVKMSLCNEYHAFCESTGINYKQAITLVGHDKRIGSRYTAVPGPDGVCGWGGTCLPKDTVSFVHQLKQSNQESYIVEAAINRNNNCDRPQQDWKNESNKGRTFI